MKKDYYRLLGIKSDADSKTIKAAYRRLARRYHPDVNDDPEAIKKFQEISEAYSVIINPTKRSAYDLLRRQDTAKQTVGRTHTAPVHPEEVRDDSAHREPVDTRVTDNRDFVAALPAILLAIIAVCCFFSMFTLLSTEDTDDSEYSSPELTASAHAAAVRTRFPEAGPPTEIPPTPTPNPVVQYKVIDLAEQNSLNRRYSLECQLDLRNNNHNCEALEGVELVYGPRNGEVVVRLNLDPLQYQSAVFEVIYVHPPAGWSLNIGDSRSNNGSGGDNNHQSNDSEVQINDNQFMAYSNSELSRSRSALYRINNFIQSSDPLHIEIRNQTVRWGVDGLQYQITSDYLFALNGQSDSEGQVNFDIYAAFNRVVSRQSNATGTGVGYVTIHLIPAG